MNGHSNGRIKIIGFICSWDAYSSVEMAGVHRRSYPASIQIVKVMCLGRIHLGLVLQAFEMGADGVILLSCPPQDCHYGSGGKARELLTQARAAMHLLGLEPERLTLNEIVAGDDRKFVRQVSAFARYLDRLGPVSLRLSVKTPVKGGKGIGRD